MLGAIIGDIVGSRFEFNNIRRKDFDFFTDQCVLTDDSIMTLAVAQVYYGIPTDIRKQALSFLDTKLLGILTSFEEKYMPTI